MSGGGFLQAMERKKLVSSIVVLVALVAAVLWHGPSFPLTVLTLCAGLVTVAKAVGLYRLRRDRKSPTEAQ